MFRSAECALIWASAIRALKAAVQVSPPPPPPHVSGAAAEAVLGACRRYRCATFLKISERADQSPSSCDTKGGQTVAY